MSGESLVARAVEIVRPSDILYKEWVNPTLQRAQYSLDLDFCAPYIDELDETTDPDYYKDVQSLFTTYFHSPACTTYELSSNGRIDIDIVRNVTKGLPHRQSVAHFVRAGFYDEGRELMTFTALWGRIGEAQLIKGVNFKLAGQAENELLDEWGI